MTTTPPEPEDRDESKDENEDEDEPTISFEKENGEPDYGRATQPPPAPGAYPPPPGWGSPPPGFAPPPPGYGYPPPGYPQQPYGAHPGAPFGVHPVTGIPYSDKQKLVAGLLQVLLPFGIGRMYIGDVGLGVAQLVVTIVSCGIGALWPFIDGIIMLTGDPTDQQGRPLRP